MKPPTGASPEVQQAFKDLIKEVEALKQENRSLRGSRITDVGTPIEPRDVATKGYIDAQIRKLSEITTQVKKQFVSFVTGGSGGTGGGGGGTSAAYFGYYGALTIQNGDGDYTSVVKNWTNIVYLGSVDAGVSEVQPSERKANLKRLCDRAAAQGFNIMLDVRLGGQQITIGDTLQCAQAVWDKVQFVILGDELSPNDFDINTEIQLLKNRMQNLGLAMKPIGATFTPNTVLTQNVGQYNFDFINIEAYTQPCACGGCGGPTIAEEIQKVKNLITQQKAIIPATKNLTMVMQGYNRNGAWSLSEADLALLNKATWFDMAKGDGRVKAIMIFAYWRENPTSCGTNHGTFGMPLVASVHQDIWRDMTGGVTTGGPKKCLGETQNCPGTQVCCDGGTSNPCECPRLCEGGSYADMVEAAVVASVAAHPELFSGGLLLSEVAGQQLVGFVCARFNADNPTLRAIPDPSDGKQALVRRISAPEFREDYRIWNSGLTIAHQPGAYRASCWGVALDF